MSYPVFKADQIHCFPLISQPLSPPSRVHLNWSLNLLAFLHISAPDSPILHLKWQDLLSCLSPLTNTHFNRKPCLHWNYKSDSPGNRLCTGYLQAGDSGERALGNNPCEGVREERWGGGEIEWVALQRYPELRQGSGAFVAQYLSIRCVLPQGVGVSLS